MGSFHSVPVRSKVEWPKALRGSAGPEQCFCRFALPYCLSGANTASASSRGYVRIELRLVDFCISCNMSAEVQQCESFATRLASETCPFPCPSAGRGPPLGSARPLRLLPVPVSGRKRAHTQRTRTHARERTHTSLMTVTLRLWRAQHSTHTPLTTHTIPLTTASAQHTPTHSNSRHTRNKHTHTHATAHRRLSPLPGQEAPRRHADHMKKTSGR